MMALGLQSGTNGALNLLKYIDMELRQSPGRLQLDVILAANNSH